MRKMLLVAGAAVAALSFPAFGQGHGHGGGLGGGIGGGIGGGVGGGIGGAPAGIPAGPPQGLPPGPPTTIPPSPNANTHASGQVGGDLDAQTDSHANARAQTRTGANVDHSTSATTDNDNTAATGAGIGILKGRSTRHSTTGTSASANLRERSTARSTPNYGGNTCPPGLAGRNPACVPPGLANKTYRVGQRLSGNFKYYSDLSAIPDTAKSQIPSQYQTGAYRYIYQTNRIYVVDRSTNKVATVINLNP